MHAMQNGPSSVNRTHMSMWRFALAFGACLCGYLPAIEAATTSPAADAFQMWLNAINTENRAAIAAFIHRYDRKYSVQDELDFHESMGKLRVLELTAISENEIHALIRGSLSDNTLLATFVVDPGHPTTLLKFQLEGTEPPDQFKIRRWQLEPLLKEAGSRITAMERSDKMSGAFLLVQGNRVLFKWSGGKSDRATDVGNNLHTKFRLASLGKMFTAVAILQLAEAGKLSLDDSIAQHLPDYPDASIARRVTLRQLLNHTSGLGDIFDDDFPAHSDHLRTHADYVKFYGARPLKFDPGTQDGYSNFGYIILGAVIESVTGQSYYDYVDQHVYAKAGMTRTGSEPESANVEGLARPYTKDGDHWVLEKTLLPWRGTAAGGGYSTVGDLLKFAQALEQGQLISADSLAAATEPQNNKRWYGFGFMVGGKGMEQRFGHEGGAPGMNAAIYVYPDAGYTVIGLSNSDPSAMGNLVNFVGNRLPLPLDQKSRSHGVH